MIKTINSSQNLTDVTVLNIINLQIKNLLSDPVIYIRISKYHIVDIKIN